MSRDGPTAPMFFNRFAASLWLQNLYAGRTLFLCLGGPSFTNIDHAQLSRPGVITLGVNNMPVTYRPNLWCEVDSPQNFCASIWLDPRITKFCPLDHAEKKIFDNSSWRDASCVVGDCPGVIFFRRNGQFDHRRFLDEDSINWGNEKDHVGSAGHKGGRSVMLPAMRIAFLLGFRTIFLLGCDFRMARGAKNYHFDQDRSKGAVKNNMATYAALNKRLDLLRPIFESRGMHVFNCNPQSGLRSFDYISFADAIDYATAGFPPAYWIPADGTPGHWRTRERLRGPTTVNGRTVESGLYDRQAAIKNLKKDQAGRTSDVAESPPGEPRPASPPSSLSLADLRRARGART